MGLVALAHHPDIQARLYEEVTRVCGTESISPAHLPQLAFTEMVVRETMRLYPSVWIVLREAIADTTLGGARVPKGSLTIISPYALHRDPRYFTEPEQFNPDRFAPDAPPIPRYAYIPFITGPHVCLGSAFAMMEAKLVMASIVQRFTLGLAPGEPIHPKFAGTLIPMGEANLKVTPRTP